MKLPDMKGVMPALIAVVFLLYFGLALFGPSIFPGFKATNDSMSQTLINLTIAAVMYYIGTTQGSSKKDDVIAAGMTPIPPPAVPGTVTTTITTPPAKDPAP